MAKKGKMQAELATHPMEASWQARDDANRVMDYADLCDDPARHRAATKRITDAARHVTRKSSRGGGRR